MILPLINPQPSRAGPYRRFRLSQAKLVRAYRRAVKEGMIRRVNPRRPPREWFYRKLAEVRKRGGYRDPAAIVGHIMSYRSNPRALRKTVIVSPARELAKYFKLRSLGYRTLWSGEGKIAMEAPRKRPASRRGTHNPSKECSMVYSLIKRPRRRRAIRRRRHNPKFGCHRPFLLRAGKWYRRQRSKLFPKSMRVNPRRLKYRRNEPDPRHIFRFRRVRRNPVLPFNIVNVVIGGAKVAGGITAGMILMPVVTKFAPADFTKKYRNFYGVIHVVAGALLAAFIKQKFVKDMALVVAGVGVYDLIACNVKFLGLPALPSSSPLLGKTGDEPDVTGDEPDVIGMGTSYQQIGAEYAPALGADYQEVEGDDISYGDDGIEIG